MLTPPLHLFPPLLTPYNSTSHPRIPRAPQAVASLAACPRLRDLEINMDRLPADLLPALAGLTGLTQLVMQAPGGACDPYGSRVAARCVYVCVHMLPRCCLGAYMIW